MKFSIVLTAAPYSSEAAATALKFAKALLGQGHTIYRLFFFNDGVHAANRFTTVAENEISLQQQWDSFIAQHKIESVVCVTSAFKRGVLDEQEAKRQQFEVASMYGSSEIAGLGQLIDAAVNSDRLVNFG